MSSGISVKLPLSIDGIDGKYLLNKTIKEAVQQNLKNLILTIPGERIMNPDFGVGLRRYLFEPHVAAIQGQISGKIRQQVNKYMGFVEIKRIDFFNSADSVELLDNSISIRVSYRISPISTEDSLDLLVRETV